MRWLRIPALLILSIVFGQWAAACDSVIIRKDTRLDVLTAKQVQLNKRAAMLNGNGQYKGYRIQVVSTTRRDEAFKIKTDLLTKFPDQKTYVMFQSPSFKVRMGNFIKKDDAEKLKAELNRLFQHGVYIVEDAIEYTPKDDDEPTPQ